MLGSFSLLYRQAVEEAGIHRCLPAPTMDIKIVFSGQVLRLQACTLIKT